MANMFCSFGYYKHKLIVQGQKRGNQNTFTCSFKENLNNTL